MLLDINCDMGESTDLWSYSLEHDVELLNWVSSVNLACGYHAGDARVMHELVKKSLEKGLKIGAHPAYPDRRNFGRSPVSMTGAELYDITIHQLGGLAAFLALRGAKLHHVKPHGALYNYLANAPSEARDFLEAVRDFDANLIVYGLSGSAFLKLAVEMDLAVKHEVFADRRYHSNGSLVDRSNPLAMLNREEEVVSQVKAFARQEAFSTIEGLALKLKADTVCIHSDSKGVLSLLKILDSIEF